MDFPLRYSAAQKILSGWCLLDVQGADRENFFQGQVTNDLNALSVNQAQLTARLNRVGKLQSFFFIAKLSDKLLILCQEELKQTIIDDFTKYIIMDDVEISDHPAKKLNVIFNPSLLTNKPETLFELDFFGIPSALTVDVVHDLNKVNDNELESLRVLNGFPLWGKDVDSSQFINDSFLNELAISYKKGCFLGQETVAKIENNRGAAYFPVLLKTHVQTDNTETQQLDHTDFDIEGRKAGKLNYQVKNYFQISLLRDYRIAGKMIELKTNAQSIKGEVVYLPYFKKHSATDMALELYHAGVDKFQAGNQKTAMELMEKAIAFDPAFSDAYESIGVILGREEKFQEAINWMDKLLAVKENSVMAHTNKSLYLMKLGKIEEAEAEKALATVKSFAMYGEEAKMKKALEAEKQKKEEDILRREKMFLQVLEIDPDDTIALFGMADIFFFRNQFELAVNNLKRVLEIDKKYSTAYLLLGKSYEALRQSDNAVAIYQQGIEAAGKQGDMMPANEMQSRLNQLVMSSRLS